MKNNNSFFTTSFFSNSLYRLAVIFFLFPCVGVLVSCVEPARQEVIETKYSAMGSDTFAGLGGELPTGVSRVVRVTNLDAEGEGSFAWALSLPHPRVVVFEVGGVIDLEGKGVTITQPYLTVAGQSAPEPGITLIRGGLGVRTHDVRIQHIRVRPGDNYQAKRSGWESDGISVSGEYAKDVHIDHVSVSWAVDENLSASGNRYKGHGYAAERVTFSHCLIAEALDFASHRKGKHSKGLLVHDHARDIGVVNNIFAHNDRRNPYFKANTTGFVANNLIYNPGNAAVQVNYIEDEWVGQSIRPGNAQLTLLNNVLRYGRDTYSDLALLSSRGDAFLQGNQVVNLEGESMPIVDGAISVMPQPPLWQIDYKSVAATGLEKALLQEAGATPWARDAVDRRIISDIERREGRIIDSQQEVGGYPDYKPTFKKFDISDDKIADWLSAY